MSTPPSARAQVAVAEAKLSAAAAHSEGKQISAEEQPAHLKSGASRVVARSAPGDQQSRVESCKIGASESAEREANNNEVDTRVAGSEPRESSQANETDANRSSSGQSSRRGAAEREPQAATSVAGARLQWQQRGQPRQEHSHAKAASVGTTEEGAEGAQENASAATLRQQRDPSADKRRAASASRAPPTWANMATADTNQPRALDAERASREQDDNRNNNELSDETNNKNCNLIADEPPPVSIDIDGLQAAAHLSSSLLSTNCPTAASKELSAEPGARSAPSAAQAIRDLEAHPSASVEFLQKERAPKRLGYCQALLLRKWPCLALSICIMSSLIFGMLLSALTLYLMHDVTDCGQLAMAAGLQAPHQFSSAQRHASLLPLSADFGPHEAAPIEAYVGGAGSPPVVGPPSRDPAEPLAGRHLLSSGGALAADSNNQSKAAPTFQRLPTSLAPEHYDLFIWPHIAEPFQFNGSVEILLKCRQPTDNITLHTLDLELNERSIKISRVPLAGPRKRRQRSAVNMTARVASNAADQKLEQGAASNSNKTSNTNNNSQNSAESAHADLRADEMRAPKVTRLSQNKQLQYSIVHLDQQLEAGRDYLLRIDFVGTLNDDLSGFYKIKYERANSSEITWIAATQFQATDARRAFPCFDEPHFKATFSIKIKHWANMTALSNMPKTDSERSADGLWVTDTFAKSHRMSTYLVAYAVTNFESRSDGNISVWTRPGFSHAAEYALKIAGKILRHYEDFFGIEYPLPKMDMIALPDFNAGAMENWGLITYRETAMLFDEADSSVANKQRVAVVVAHELAHQWFGNLVTPKWWDDLWLNEGFASFVEYIGVNHVEPRWRMLEQFVLDEVHDVFQVDCLPSSHQISIPVNNPDEISEIFDHISYAKGASVIRMMSHFLGEEVFKLGLRRYLRALKYANAEQSDLWSHLTEAQRSLAAGHANSSEMVDVASVMNSWTLQSGYPLVTLARNYNQHDGSLGTLEQVRYQPNSKSSESPAAKGQRWEIPITFTWRSDQNWRPTTRLWMRANESQPVALDRSLAPSLAADEWLLLNTQEVGYYRVNYDLKNWRLLIAQLQEDHTKIHVTNRAQILNDLFELAKSSIVEYPLALEAVKYLKNEREFFPWDSTIAQFNYINEMLQRTPIYGNWRDYVAQLIEPYYARYKDIEWTRPPKQQQQIASANKSVTILTPETSNSNLQLYDDNDSLETYNHLSAVLIACQLNNEHCTKRAREVFAQYKATGKNNIRPALRYDTYCTAIRLGTKEDWDFLWRMYERAQSSTERDRIIRALCCSSEMWILSRFLEMTFNKTGPIRRQDGTFVFRWIVNNNNGRDLAFNYVREHWTTIKEIYGKTSFNLGQLIKSMASSRNTQVELDEFKAFFESTKGDVGSGKRAFQNAIDEVESNVAWRNKHYKILDSWLQRELQTSRALRV